jgi:transcriptional regulator with XRE-family HTH domain
VEVPSPDVLKKLSSYFGMPVSELLGEDEIEETKKEQPITMDGLSDDLVELIEHLKTLPEDKIQMLLQVAKSIK